MLKDLTNRPITNTVSRVNRQNPLRLDKALPSHVPVVFLRSPADLAFVTNATIESERCKSLFAVLEPVSGGACSM